MQKIIKVAQREYIETVKTKTFLLMILLLPVMIGLMIFFIGKMEPAGRSAAQSPLRVAVADLSGQLSTQIRASFDEHNQKNPNKKIVLLESGATEEQEKERLRRGELDVYVVLDKDVLMVPDEDVVEETPKMRVFTHKPKPAVIEALWTVESPVRDAVFRERCKRKELPPKLIANLRNLPVEHIKIGEPGGVERVQSEGDRVARMMVPFFFMYLLFLGIFGMSGQMLSSIIEEKNSRVIEVLLSAVSPFELMAGKILGLGGVGLTVVFLWGASAIGVARWKGFTIEMGPAILTCFIVYYVLGFFLASSFMVGIGSICNTIKESQGLLKPVILVSVVPLIAWIHIVRDPNGTLARVLSFLPPTTPMVMVVRLTSGADIWIVETVLSMLLLVVSVLGGTWVAARVFRIGILMYGKPPGLREIGRWLKEA